MNWVARQAAAAAPQSLPNPVEAAVRDNFRRQRLALDDDERQAQRTAADHSEEAGRALRDRLADLGQELRKTQQRAADRPQVPGRGEVAAPHGRASALRLPADQPVELSCRCHVEEFRREPADVSLHTAARAISKAAKPQRLLMTG